MGYHKGIDYVQPPSQVHNWLFVIYTVEQEFKFFEWRKYLYISYEALRYENKIYI